MGSKTSGQAMRILQEFMRVKHRVTTVLPHELSQLKERIPDRPRDYDLFLRTSSALYEEGELTMTLLSEALGVPRNTATRMVDWLVKSGYADRLPDPEDRRVVRVTLTQGGRELYEAINAFLDRILSSLTVEERRTLISLLQKVMGVLK